MCERADTDLEGGATARDATGAGAEGGENTVSPRAAVRNSADGKISKNIALLSSSGRLPGEQRKPMYAAQWVDGVCGSRIAVGEEPRGRPGYEPTPPETEALDMTPHRFEFSVFASYLLAGVKAERSEKKKK